MRRLIGIAHNRINPVVRWLVAIIGGGTAVVIFVAWAATAIGHGGYSVSTVVHTAHGRHLIQLEYPSTRPLWAAIVGLKAWEWSN